MTSFKILFTQTLLAIFLVSTLANAVVPELQVVDHTRPVYTKLAVLTAATVVLATATNTFFDFGRMLSHSTLRGDAKRLDCSSATSLENDEACENFKEEVLGGFRENFAEISLVLGTVVLGIYSSMTVPVSNVWKDKRGLYMAAGVFASGTYFGLGTIVQKAQDDAKDLTVPAYLNNTDVDHSTKVFKIMTEVANVLSWTNAALYATHFAGWTLKHLMDAERAAIARYKLSELAQVSKV